MKKRIVFLAAAATASLTVALSGCASSGTANLIALSSNWYALTTFKGIQPTFTEGQAEFSAEKLTYQINFTAPATGNSSYSVSYAPGTYSTEFYATAFQADEFTYAGYRDGYPSAGNEAVAYCYKTERLFPSVTFTYGADSKTFENDKVTTVCYFLSCGDYLRPLYSRMAVKSATPANYQAGNIDSTYRLIDREYVNYYNYAGTEVRTEITDNLDDTNSQVKTQGLNAGNTLFDVHSLDIAIRAMSNLSANLSQSVNLMTPGAGVKGFSLIGSSAALSDEESTAMTALLTEHGLHTPKTDLEEGEKDAVSTVAVSVRYNAEFSGVSQTYWYAAIGNKLNNTGRATMLKMTSPVNYNLGTFTYLLSEIESTFWNG